MKISKESFDLKKIRKVSIFLIALLILIVKTIIYTSIASSNNGMYMSKFNIDIKIIGAQIGFILIVLVPYMFLKGKNQFRYLIGLDIIYTIFLISEILYFRDTGYFYTINNFLFPQISKNIFEINYKFYYFELLLLIDLPLIIWVYVKEKKIFEDIKRNIVIPIVVIVLSVIVINQTRINIDIKNITDGELSFSKIQWSPSITQAHMSPIGYQYYNFIDCMMKRNAKITEDDRIKVSNWFKWNEEDLPKNEYWGMYKGKNVIFLQVESLENFVINQQVQGQEITPNINKIVKNGVYFSNIYEQNNAGSSVDCDLMALTSVLPLKETITFLTDSQTSYNSMPSIMKANGYNTSTAHGVPLQNFNWAQNHRSLGFDKIWSASEFELKEWVGGYRSDEEYLAKYGEMILKEEKPFYSLIATITSHGPFQMQDEKKELNLTTELNENRLGEYFQSIHYTDKQVGMLLGMLEKANLLDDTVIVLYGDHGGVHKYYQKLIEDAPLEGDWWKDDSMELPLVIYNPSIEPKVVTNHGGQTDIMPTVLGLLGIEQPNLMGRNLLNTNRDATVYNDRYGKYTIAGNPKNDEEKKRLMEAYDVARILIKKDYYLKEGLLNN